MSQRASGRAPRRLFWSVAVALVVGGCADFATTPDRVPESLSIEPEDTVVTQGDRAPLRVIVLDQDGQPFSEVPSWAPPEWWFSDPQAVVVAPDGSLETTGGGEISVKASLAGLTARSNLRVNPGAVALSAPEVYLVQSVQNLQGDVPLVAGLDALLRVFVVSDPTSFYQPRARASFILEGTEVHSSTLFPGSYIIEREVSESALNRSFNAFVPGAVLQPGLEMVIELDIDAVVPLSPGSQLRIPAEGTQPLDVRVMPRLDLTVVPILVASSPDEGVFDWIAGMTPGGETLRFTRAVIPIGELDLEVHETYTTSLDLTTQEGWSALLREMLLLRTAEGGQRHYYGAFVLPPGSKWGGLGYIGLAASIGRPTAATFAHELGHNFSLRHAPCGNVASSDANYPYAGGTLGVWGYEGRSGSTFGLLKNPDQYKDLMGYCSPKWISDYHFKKAMDFRLRQEQSSAQVQPAESVLLLWGSAGAGELILEPAFALEAPPLLPTDQGPYRIEGRDEGGRTIFSMSFTPLEVEHGGGHFAFAIPLQSQEIENLASVSLSGPEGAVALDRASPLPRMAMAVDAATGQILAIRRDGAVPDVGRADATITYSDGLPGGDAGRRR